MRPSQLCLSLDFSWALRVRKQVTRKVLAASTITLLNSSLHGFSQVARPSTVPAVSLEVVRLTIATTLKKLGEENTDSELVRRALELALERAPQLLR